MKLEWIHLEDNQLSGPVPLSVAALAEAYGAAVNQMQAFITPVNDMVANGTLTPAQAAPFIEQAERLIAIWTGMLEP